MNDRTLPATAEAIAGGTPSTAVRQAVRNGVKLIASLFGTWGVALVVRLGMPRFMGPDQFGVVNFADALTATVFVLISFGVDTYIRKEVTLRETHADDFFGSLLLVRLGMTALLLCGLAAAMALTDQPPLTREAVYLFGFGQLFFVTNNTFAALLQARGRVDGLAIINVVAKVGWGAGVAVALFGGGGPRAVAVAFVLSEAVRTFVLFGLSRRHAGLQLQLRWESSWSVAVASTPFFLSVISHTVCTRVGSSLLGFFAVPAEVGYYGAAWTLAGMALMLAPLVQWVLMPLLSQAAASSSEELLSKARRALELMLATTIPVALLLSLGADVVVRILFGVEYAPAVLALRIMAPVVVLTYAAMVTSACLILQDRPWTTTWVSVGSLFLNPLLLVLLVPVLGEKLGTGGAGVGAAIALLVAESVAFTRLAIALRGGSFDRLSIVRIGRTAGACLLVVGGHVLLPVDGLARLAIDGCVYTVLVLGMRAFPIEEFRRLATALVERRRAEAR